MRIYIIGNDGITLCSEPPATVNEGEIVVASHGRERPHPSLSPPRTDINATGLDCPKPSPLAGDSPMYRPRQLVDFATPITTALMVHGFEASPQVARRQLLRL